jgi:hypothetical protein
MSLSTRILSGATALALATSTPGAAQQWTPSPPTNLKVFPKNTPVRELLPEMKRFTAALGVRCQHCHVYTGENPDDLSKFDFASDEKPAKLTARLMLKMAGAINDDLLKGVGEPATAAAAKVTCYTCHRGEKRPLTQRPPA